MKFMVPELRVGQQVDGEVAEIFSNRDVLVNFRGDLILVKNNTTKEFHLSQRIRLRVLSLVPLSFQLVGPRTLRAIDVSV